MRISDNKEFDVQRAQLVVAAVTLEFGTPYMEVKSNSKGANDVCFARQVAMYLMNVSFGISLTRIGQTFNRDRSTAGHACNVIEDYREDPLMDEKLSRLETFLDEAKYLVTK